MLLLGSHAMNHWVPGFRRKPVDVDLLATSEEALELSTRKGYEVLLRSPESKNWAFRTPDGTTLDIEVVRFGSAADSLYRWHQSFGRFQVAFTRLECLGGEWVGIPDKNVLYMLKRSHRYLKNSPHFLKTMQDLKRMEELGCSVVHPEWLAQREKDTYTYKHPSLMRPKQDFFKGDQVQYVYDHDSLHQAVKVGKVPAYQLFSSDGHEVHSSKAKFQLCTQEQRLNAVLEESYVLALERSQIPYRNQVTPINSFRVALEKVCTSITSGWFREFAYDNYFTILTMYQGSYIDKFDAALKSGVVKEYQCTTK